MHYCMGCGEDRIGHDNTLPDGTVHDCLCINDGCTNLRSNASSECFECRFAPYGTEWQLEQQERGLYP